MTTGRYRPRAAADQRALPSHQALLPTTATYRLKLSRVLKMDPSQYGAAAWHFFQATAGNAVTDRKRQGFVRMMEAVPDAFGCDLCGEHLRQGMQQYNIRDFSGSAERLLRWVYIMHDAANNHYNAQYPDRPRKSSPPWESVRDMYLSTEANEPAPVAAASAGSTPFHPVPDRPRGNTLSVMEPVARRAGRSSQMSSQMTIMHPAFEGLKQSFAMRRR